MNDHMNQYLLASGVDRPEEFAPLFNQLVQRIPSLPSDEKQAIITIKKILHQSGFKYDNETFKAQDVLNTKKANCLGLPLLIGALRAESGNVPHFRATVIPMDKGYECEKDVVLPRLQQDIKYNADHRDLQTENNPQEMQFQPLEHLVIAINGGVLVESTTVKDHTAPPYQSSRDATYEQILSFVERDRGILASRNNDPKKAKQHMKNALQRWTQNRETYSMLADIAIDTEDKELFEDAKRMYLSLPAEDSLYYFNAFNLTKDPAMLEKSLKLYPAFAEAIAQKAELLKSTDKGESKSQFAIASHLYSLSECLDLADFYINHHASLGELFGKEHIEKNLTTFRHKAGHAPYYAALFNLTGKSKYKAEYNECFKN